MKLGLIHIALLIGAICAVAHASPAPAKAQIIGGHRVGESALTDYNGLSSSLSIPNLG